MDKTTSDEQIKKQTPTPAGTRWKKYILYVPIRRRSKRCKKQASSSSQGSKAETSSGSPPSHSTKRKKDMMDESSSRQSASGTVEHCEGEEDEMDSLEITNVRMRACAYKALFQKQEKKVKVSGQVEELDGSDKSFIKYGSNSGDHTQKEGTAAVEICHITGDDSLPVQEAAEVICEEESTQMRQKFDHNFQFRSSPKSVDMDRSDDPRRIGGISLSLDGDAHKNKVLKEQIDVDAIEVAVVVDKANTPVRSTSGHKENNVGESSGLNIGSKSWEPEAGIYFKSCEKSAQLLNPSLDTQGNDSAADPEQLCRFTAAGSKENSSQFMEFWVPAQMSHVQLEQYCSILVNSLSLRSPSRTDPVGALHDILTAARKCCDHPYLVDSTLQNLLIKDLQPAQVLDIGIQASGKLELLDKILVEMRTRGLRILILFQNIGSFGEKDSINVGDILDDAVRRRFGEKSYERVAWGLARPKIQTALNNFNNKEFRRFVFLIEARACRPIIKLSSVDVVVIFGSDWQPGNDIKNLQKMTLESESENIKVFRLYSCFTVEEKVLISSRKGLNLDGRVQERTASTCHMLLMWEAAYLFKKLNEFHCSYLESSRLILSDLDNTNAVIKELISFLPVEENNLRSSSMVLRVENDGSFYHTDSPLYGESKSQLATEESLSPPKFWTKLLEGKHPRWKYSSGSSQRNRRHNIHSYKSDADEFAKKRKKLANNNGVQSPRKRGKGKIAGEKGSPPTLEQDLDNHMDGGVEAIKLCDSQKILHLSLQLEISRLCEVLNLGDKVKNMAQIFLDYIINNHHVAREPATILQAFQLALCWTAASMLKVKVAHKESLQLVKTHMSYVCKKDEADLVYAMLHDLKQMFLEQRRSDMGDLEDLSLSKDDVNIPDNSAEERISKAIKKIKRKYGKQMEKLMQQQKKEIDEVHKAYEAGKTTLENKRQIETAVIRLHREGPTRTDMLNTLERNITGKIEERKKLMTARLNQLDRAYHASRTKLHLKEASCIKSLKEWAQTELVDGDNAQTSAGPNVADGPPDHPRDVNVGNLPESPWNAAVSSACKNLESFSEGLVDLDPENYISVDPCVGENIAHGAREEVSLDSLLLHTASCTNVKTDQVNLIPQGGEICSLPNREGVCSHSDTVDAESHSVQPLQNQIPDRTIADEATEITVADDFTSVVEQVIAGTPKDQASHPKEFGDSAPVQPLATLSQSASTSTALPEELHDQSNGIAKLNAPAPVSLISDATPPDQWDSVAADAELTSSVPNISPVNGTSQVTSVKGQNSVNNQATLRPFEEIGEPQMKSVQGISIHAPASGHGIHLPGYASTSQSSFPSVQTSFLMPSGMGDRDLLQTEIDKIQKEVACRMRTHEDLKMQLKLNCEKEVERTVSQIRHKYKAKEQEAEAHYTLKKKELEANYNQVHMNKILAAAFRFKCMDFGAPEPRSRPDAFINLEQEMMLSEPNPASSPCIPLAPPGILRPSPVPSSALTSTTRQSVDLVKELPVQPLLHHSTPTRVARPRGPPPVIGQFTTPVTVQVRPNVRRPAPHLQPFRPSPSPSPVNLPPRGVFPSYQTVGLSPSTASSHCPDAVQQKPTPQKNSMWHSPNVSSSNIIEIRSMRENAAIQMDSSQIVCVSDDDE